MKSLFTFILICFSLQISAQQIAKETAQKLQQQTAQKTHQQGHYIDKPSTHGMMLMGNEVLYASHLPMFHSPHDYQIILLLELSPDDMKRYTAERKKHPEELVYTIEPETFVLPEMVNYTKIFKGSIYRGHFERGGVKFIENVPVKIKQVVYYTKFQKDAQRAKDLQYILFGNPDEQFMVHQINAKPDFDENLSVHINDKQVLKTIAQKGYVSIEFPESDLRKPFSWKQSSGLLKVTRQPLDFQQHKLLYLEFDDLN